MRPRPGIRHGLPARLGGRPVPNQRASTRAARRVEEERRLAHVGLTRARRRAKIFFASNRRIHGLWNSTVPSRFVDDLPETNVEIAEAPANFSYGGYAAARASTACSLSAARPTRPPAGSAPRRIVPRPRTAAIRPPLRRPARADADRGRAGGQVHRRLGLQGRRTRASQFGPGTIEAVDGNKLTVEFDKAGRKMVLDSFVEALG